jgi:hypothetical protein
VKHLVQFSTGAGSAEVAWRVVEKYGAENVVALSADTKAEDDDNWRFAREVIDRLGCEWVILSDGRTPMQVGRDVRVVPNNRMAVCSRVLKRELLRAHIDAHYDPADTTIYLGFDWTEQHRIAAAWPQWAPYTVAAPLAEPPYLMKEQILNLFRDRGIEPPLLYKQGFAHANCGGACVRGGQAQWSLLLQVNRPRYLEWEAEERETRVMLGKDVAILRDRSGDTTKPLTLEEFRRRIEVQPALFDADDWGACGCFTAEEAA